ncbi:MAG: hypothetical protein RIM96_01545 [Thalassobaculum sp.]|uniref:hypothetical protein n=1 Tax=Thalassobaculum sp. TaxID=2022740 RepID=UPI0032EBC61B
MLVSNTPLAGVPAPVPKRMPATGAGPTIERAPTDTGTSRSLAGAGEAAGKSRTARRDALARDLQRLLEVARKLNGVGDLRSNADALQSLAREIAKVARALADAERALPAAARRGVPAVAVPPAPAAAAATPSAADTDAGGGRPGETEAEAAEGRSDLATDEKTSSAGDATAASGDTAPSDAGLEQGAAPREESGDAGRGGTRALLKYAAEILKKMRDTVSQAERMEALIDPEAARERHKAVRELDGYIAELGALALDFADPARGQGIDLST